MHVNLIDDVLQKKKKPHYRRLWCLQNLAVNHWQQTITELMKTERTMAEAFVANACTFISKKHTHTNARADSGAAFMLSYLQFMCLTKGLLLLVKDVCSGPDSVHTGRNCLNYRTWKKDDECARTGGCHIKSKRNKPYNFLPQLQPWILKYWCNSGTHFAI